MTYPTLPTRLMLGLLLVGLACLLPTSALAARKPTIACSIVPVAEFVGALVGDVALVSVLVPPTASYHDFQIRPQLRREIEKATLVATLGFPHQIGVEDLINSVRTRESGLIVAADGLPMKEIATLSFTPLGCLGHNHEDHEHHPPAKHSEMGYNEHVWHDPVFAQGMVASLAEQLQRHLPDHKASIAANCDRYLTTLRELHQEFNSAFAKVTPRPVVTFHNAYPYLFARYKLPLAAVVMLNPEGGATPKGLASLTQTIREQQVGTVFIEPQFESSFLSSLSSELGFRTDQLDSLGKFKGDGSGYVQLMRENVAALLRAYTPAKDTLQP